MNKVFLNFINPNFKIMNIVKKIILFEDNFDGLIYLFINAALPIDFKSIKIMKSEVFRYIIKDKL